VPDLAPFASVDATELRWVRTEGHHEFELKAGDTAVARLHWRSASGSFATATTARGALTIKRAGFLNPKILVREAGTERTVGILHVHWSVSSLELKGGRTYRWMRKSFWVPTWEFDDANGQNLLRIEPAREGSHLVGGLLTLAPAALANPDLEMLLLLGWYFVVLAFFEDEIAAGASAALAAVS